MGIRVSCSEMGHESLGDYWVEFREARWTFGDRRKITSLFNDAEIIEVMLPYVEAWNLKDIDGKDLEVGKKVDVFDNVEDDLVVWFILAWYEARKRRLELKKES